MLEFTDGNFKAEVEDSDGAVLVDFWAPWCGPCRMVGPILEELSKEYEGRIKIGKVNVDDNPGTASKFGIQSIPTLLFFKEGKVVEKIIGALPRKAIKDKIEEVL